MEAWLAELEMDVDPTSTLINNLYHQSYETMELSFDEQITTTLGEEFSYPLPSKSNNTAPQWDFDCNIIEHFTSSPSQFLNNSGNQDVIINEDNNNNVNDSDSNSNSNNDKDNNNDNDNNMVSSNFNVQEKQQLKGKEETKKKQGVSGGITKRKRQPSQVQDHILAERKRRELLSQLFISLSAIVPGLKKVDKTSVLGEAIKYMKQLQEKVKILEEVAAKRTVVVVKKSQLKMDNDDNDSSCTVADSCTSGNGGLKPNNQNGGNSDDANSYNDSLSEIEVKISGKTLLLRIYCEDQKGILAKLFAELDKHAISVTNCSVVPFDNLALDITIVAQIMERSFNNNVKDFIRSVRSTLRLSR